MTALHTSENIERAVESVRSKTDLVPDVALILGTGLGGFYEDIPGFPLSTVETHAGRLLFGELGGERVVAMQGRFHLYEGYSMQQITFPVRVMRALGAGNLIVSNACGGMNPLWSAGDLVLISDHINLLGDNPLIGSNDDSLGPRFPDMSSPYDPALREIARDVAREMKLTLREGVYVAVPGPNLETAAEYRFLRTIGADVVGMSTVPEVIVAVHGGMRTLGVSIITDECLPDALDPADIDKIIATAQAAEPNITRLVAGVLQRMD